MENLSHLQAQKKQLERELEKISVKGYGSSPWASGVQDQYKSDSYSYTSYTDPKKAAQLKSQLEQVEYKISTYGKRAQREREMSEVMEEMKRPQYEYNVAGDTHTTSSEAIKAKYDAQKRYFAMNKFQKAVANVTGQKKKFERLWVKAGKVSEEQDRQIAEELGKMFR